MRRFQCSAASIMLLLASSAEAQQGRWVFLFNSPNGRTVYLDSETYTTGLRTAQKPLTKRGWYKIAAKDGSESLSLMKIDCDARKYVTENYSNFGPSGVLSEQQKARRWEDIIPETIVDGIRVLICPS